MGDDKKIKVEDTINIIVYDLGGGTLDVSLLNITDGLVLITSIHAILINKNSLKNIQLKLLVVCVIILHMVMNTINPILLLIFIIGQKTL